MAIGIQTKLYFMVDFGCPPLDSDIAYGEMEIGPVWPCIPYEELVNAVNKPMLAEAIGVAPDRLTIITPEEYALRFGKMIEDED